MVYVDWVVRMINDTYSGLMMIIVLPGDNEVDDYNAWDENRDGGTVSGEVRGCVR